MSDGVTGRILWTISGTQPSTCTTSAVSVTIQLTLTRTEPTFWDKARRVGFTGALMWYHGAFHPIETGVQLATRESNPTPAVAQRALRPPAFIPEPEERTDTSFDDELGNALRRDRVSASTSAISSLTRPKSR